MIGVFETDIDTEGNFFEKHGNGNERINRALVGQNEEKSLLSSSLR